MMIGEMDKIDRISELPEVILHIILSKMDSKEAFRSSVLSKKWYRVWSFIPVLDFNPKYFKKVKDIDLDYFDGRSRDDDSYDDRTVQQFIGFIDRTMQRYLTRKYRITKLNLVLPYVDEKTEVLVDKWIDIAVQNQIQELNINLLDDGLEYGLPEILFRAKSLKVLSCSMVELRYYDTMDLVSLEFFTFFYGNIDEDMLQKIISLSPLVELCVATDLDLGKISLPWSRKLNKGGESVTCGTMRYNLKTAPLKEFEYNGFTSTLPWAWNMNMSALKNLRNLKIVADNITDDIVSEMAYGLVALESLEINSCKMLKCVKISSISLKEIRIEEVDNEYHLMKITIDTPNLLEFWCSCEVEAHVSLIRAQDHCNTCFSPPWIESITTGWFVKLKKFLVETNCFKSLVIDFGNFEKIDIDEDLLRILGVTGSPYKLRELKLREKHDYFFFQSLHMGFLDALFLSCNPAVLSLSFQNMPPGDILSYLKRKVQCWKDPLKKVEVEGADCSNLLSEPPEIEFRFRLSWFSVES